MRRLAALATLTVLAGSCSVDVDFEPHGEEPASPGDSLQASLLQRDRLEELGGSPVGIVVVPPEEAGLQDDPAPRGICGTPLEGLPSWRDGAVAFFSWESDPEGFLQHSVWDLPDGQAERLFAAVEADFEPHCPAISTKRPDGREVVTPGGAVGGIEAGSAQVVSWTMHISRGDLEADGAGAAIRRGTRFAYLLTFSEEPLDGDFLAQAIGEAAERL